MEDIAHLGIDIDSSYTDKAIRSLRGFQKASREAEQGTNRLGNAAEAAGEKTRRGAVTASAAMRAFGSVISNVKAEMVAFGTAAAGAVATAFALAPLFSFTTALSEVSTLVDTATFNMGKLSKAARLQAAAFGTSPTAQVKAFYQIISAGASTAAQATEILTQANKLAIGGVTEIGIAADGLTSVLNAYGDKVEGAEAVSDALFVAMRAGKTTIGELSSTLGKVAPLAAQTGVAFDELAAAVSALTKGGISTAESVTGVRAILASIAKPTKEAQELSKKLGIEFTAAGLEAKGFAAFLTDLVEKTGGNTAALSLLFGGVEALVPIMALAGSAGKDFTAILEGMEKKAGETELAVSKMTNSPAFQARRVWSSLQAEVLGLTTAMGSGLTAAFKAVADSMGTLVDLATVAGAALLTAFGPVILTAVKTLTIALARGLVGALVAVAAAARANPLTAIATAIVTVASALWAFQDDVKRIFGLDIPASVKIGANFIVGSMIGAYDAVMATWELMPKAFKDLAIQAANYLIETFNNAIKSIIGRINRIIGAVKEALPGQTKYSPDYYLWARDYTLDPINNDAEGAAAEAGKRARKAFEDAYKVDYFPSKPEPDSDVATSSDPSRTAVEDALKATGVPDLGALGSGGGKEKLKTTYADLVKEANNFIQQQSIEQKALRLTDQEANTLRYTMDLLNKAQEANIKLSPQQAEGLARLAASMAAAEAQTENVRKAVGRAQEAIDDAKGATREFLGGFIEGLKEGKTFIEALRDSLMGFLERLQNRFLDNIVDLLFSGTKATGNGPTGPLGFLASLFQRPNTSPRPTAPSPVDTSAYSTTVATAGKDLSVAAAGISRAATAINRATGTVSIGSLPRTGPNVNTTGLNEQFQANLKAMIAAAKQAGHDIELRSGYRTREQQAYLYKTKGPGWAAPPGRSNHEYGLAADLAYSSDQAKQWALKNAPNYGMHFPLANARKPEPWHIEPMSATGDRVYGSRGNVGELSGHTNAVETMRANSIAMQEQTEALARHNEAIQTATDLKVKENETDTTNLATKEQTNNAETSKLATLQQIQEAYAREQEKITNLGEKSSEAATKIEQMGTSAGNAKSGNELKSVPKIKEADTALGEAANNLSGTASGFVGSFGGILQSLLGGIDGIGGNFISSFASILGQLLSSLGNSGGKGGGGGFFGFIGKLIGGLFEKGGVFSSGRVVPFASGGIVTQPTAFPMADDKVGLMGERGKEAIMPLRKGSNGRLGVEAVVPQQQQTIRLQPIVEFYIDEAGQRAVIREEASVVAKQQSNSTARQTKREVLAEVQNGLGTMMKKYGQEKA